ncbi:MAG: hypothetical protein NUV65_01140 [Candidatus Roizmanbacteria bacterium]|nr:hypothetical protein [Candidatus Roizmanbacteria bacterium]
MNVAFDVFKSIYSNVIAYIPALLSGVGILLVGLIIAPIANKLTIALLKLFEITRIYSLAGIKNTQSLNIWRKLIGEIIRWAVLLAFLIPALEVWGFSRIVTIVNNLLFYLPNVLIAMVISLIGYLLSNVTYRFLLQSVSTFEKKIAQTFALSGKYAVVIFATLASLNQLGVAQDLIRILFTGIVFTITLALGLAFGLGGKDVARETLEGIQKKLSK